MRRACVASSLVSSTAAAALRCSSSCFHKVPMGPPDPILGLSVAFKEDTAPVKVNLGVGVYRGDENEPIVLECVKKVADHTEMDNEYAPITGLPGFVNKAQKLAFADSAPRVEERIASSQSLSGTGALRVAGDFLSRYHSSKNIIVPNPTWGNHNKIFGDAQLKVGKYSYYEPKTKGLNINGMLEDLGKAEPHTIVLLHACAHNPTGVDPTLDQWKEIIHVIKKRHLLPLVDMAYQGFASGDCDRDAHAARMLADAVPNMVLCQSFAKNFGLYGQRVGGVHFVCHDSAERERVLSQMKILIRPMYSNPPLYGARIVDKILGDEKLTQQWRKELTGMADRMNGIRGRLVEELRKCGTLHDWSHITSQIGMMAFTGLSKDQVHRLKTDFHVYMTDDGRAAVSGLNSQNVQYVAKALHEVTK